VFIVPRLVTLYIMLVVCGVIVLQIERAKRGAGIKIRRIPALEAMTEVVGRATEMGRPVHFTAGVGNLTTRGAQAMMASLEILSYLSEMAARYNSKIITTVAQGDVYAVSEEIIKGAFIRAGHPDAYSPDMIRYLSDSQFAYAGGIAGIITREQCVANVMIGHFAAEALYIAESAHLAGAVQIAGTTNMYQLPYLIAACDYVLIGEELFAAGAYFGKNLVDLGALSGQDFARLFAVALIIIGVALGTVGNKWLTDFLAFK